MMHFYKPGPQVRYRVERMIESAKTLLHAVAKLSEKMDSYDKRITSLGSDLAKVQSQVDLSMRFIQAL
jgi:peptidoglycan hydrolase CwlO-like protein